MTPYEIFYRRPFPRRRGLVERGLDRLGLNRFFLREGKRPHFRVAEDLLVSPADSKLVEMQTLGSEQPLKGKERIGHTEWYSFEQIVHDHADRERFAGGCAFNFYLSPLNLHYCLFPTGLTVKSMVHHPHFCRPIVFMKSGEMHNERLVIRAETRSGLPLIVVLIGSFLVSGIECVAEIDQTYAAGELLGGFKLGSTVMILCPADSVTPVVPVPCRLLLGEPFARVMAK